MINMATHTFYMLRQRFMRDFNFIRQFLLYSCTFLRKQQVMFILIFLNDTTTVVLRVRIVENIRLKLNIYSRNIILVFLNTVIYVSCYVIETLFEELQQ